MDEDNLNIEIRKFLKKVGISSQRIIETTYIRKKFSEEIEIDGQSIELEMKLSSEDQNLSHTIKRKRY